MNIVSEDFKAHKSTASRVVGRVTRCIAELLPKFVKMSENERNLASTKKLFYNIAKFPNVIGIVDCTHIRILSPGTFVILTFIIHL